MHIDIDFFRQQLNIQNDHREPVLHHKRRECILRRLLQNIGMDRTAIYKKHFIIPFASRNNRFSGISRNLCHAGDERDLHQVGSDLLPVNDVDHILQSPVAGAVKMAPAIDCQGKTDVRMGKGCFFHSIDDI